MSEPIDYREAGWNHDDSSVHEFDQIHAKALDLLRDTDSFFLTVVCPDGSIEHIAAAADNEAVPAEGFFAVASIEAMRLARIAHNEREDE